MSDDEQVAIKVEGEEEPVYAPDEVDGKPVEQQQPNAAKAAVDAIKAGTNPLDALDHYTLLVALLITSIIVFVACCVSIWGSEGQGVRGVFYGIGIWGFIGSLISIILCVIMIIFKKCCGPQYITAGPIIALIFLILWLGLVFPLTFGGPFLDLDNGWIGSWASMVISGALAARAFADKAKALQKALDSQSGNEATKYALFLGIASIVVLIAACVGFSTCSAAASPGLPGYSVSLPVLSIVAVIIILVIANVQSAQQFSATANTVISCFLIIWWAIGAFITTFVAPFRGTACGLNGYIAVWLCVYAAFMCFKAAGLSYVQGMLAKAQAGKQQEAHTADGDQTPAL
jgi:hypothetical protein